jgi:hypothetical protein
MGSFFFKTSKEKIVGAKDDFFKLTAIDIDKQIVKFEEFRPMKAFVIVNVASN